VRSDYKKLFEALKDISENYGVGTATERRPRSFKDVVLETADLPMEGVMVPLYNAEGRVLYDPIITYPPGTPIACPGEVLSMEMIAHISDIIAHGEAVTGVDEEGCIKVGTGY
jgi:lysine decarboxylase